jgi:hypothetical protein
MSMHRDDDTRGESSNQVRVSPTSGLWARSAFPAEWGTEYAGAFYIGPLRTIKLLDSFCIRHELPQQGFTTFPVEQVRVMLRALYRDNPRGYLVWPSKGAESGVRLLRFTQVSSWGELNLDYLLSSRDGRFVKLRPTWPVAPQRIILKRIG